MPEFVLEGCDSLEFRDLDAFTQGYITAMFFTENDPSVTIADCEAGEVEWNEGSIPCDAGFHDLHPDALAAIIADCDRFKLYCQHTLTAAYEMQMETRRGPQDYSETQAGHDFWFTRGGHGVGFWDRGLGQVGDDLSDLCKPYGEAQVWFGDHVTHGAAPFVHYQG